MGCRPQFCPPLLSNRCAGIVASHSSPPHADSESCVAPEVTLSTIAACASMAGLPPHGPSINNLVSSYTSATSSSPSFRLVVAIMFVSSLISSLNFFSYDKNLHCVFTHKLTMFLRVMQGRLSSQEGGQLSKKRKSPNATTPLLRSPLSKMLLLPRTRSPSPRMRSPTV
jgi:hypothetical protein